MPRKFAVGLQFPPIDPYARGQINGHKNAIDPHSQYGFRETLLILAADESTSSVTPALIQDTNGDWEIPVVTGRSYKIEVFARYTSAASTTGLTLGVVADGGAAGTVAGKVQGSETPSESDYIFNSSPPTIVPQFDVISAVPYSQTTRGLSGTGVIVWEFIFNCTATGTLQFELASEVAASQVDLKEGSVLIAKRIA